MTTSGELIRELDDKSIDSLKRYVLGSRTDNYCLDPAWSQIISKAYGMSPLYFYSISHENQEINGVAVSVMMQSMFFGRKLVSLPYLDYGGILAESSQEEQFLLDKLLTEAKTRRLSLELRCATELQNLPVPENEKTGMKLELSNYNEDTYWKALNAKVRNQTRKAEKSGVRIRVGRFDLLDDYYRVFAQNMRDLGSPVHSKIFFQLILEHFPQAELCMAYSGNQPIGGLVRIEWNQMMAIPWASTLRSHRNQSPSNAIYWNSIREALVRNLKLVDFGRSTRGEGTFKFKKQWLADEAPLPWYQFDMHGNMQHSINHISSGPMELLTRVWSHLPVGVATVIGSRIRGSISA